MWLCGLNIIIILPLYNGYVLQSRASDEEINSTKSEFIPTLAVYDKNKRTLYFE